MSIYSSIDEAFKSIFSDPGLCFPEDQEEFSHHNTDFVSGMVWVTDGKETRYISLDEPSSICRRPIQKNGKS